MHKRLPLTLLRGVLFYYGSQTLAGRRGLEINRDLDGGGRLLGKPSRVSCTSGRFRGAVLRETG